MDNKRIAPIVATEELIKHCIVVNLSSGWVRIREDHKMSPKHHPAAATNESVIKGNAARGQPQRNRIAMRSVRTLSRSATGLASISCKNAQAGVTCLGGGPRCEIATPGRTWAQDHVPWLGRGDRNQQRSGGRVAGRHEAGSKVAEVMNRSGRMADPKLHSSSIFGLVSWRTLLSRVRHGVNRARVAPRHDRDDSGRMIEGSVPAVISG